MTATVPTRRTKKIRSLLHLRRRPLPPGAPGGKGPVEPDIWLAGLRLGS
ncbi:hypothetical protein GCM10023080_037710 [Streptomyces pseudoechinosporeus]